MNQTLGCHGPLTLCQDAQVERLDTVICFMTIHNIQEMSSDGSLMGYILDNEERGHMVMKAPSWDKWYEQKP